MEIGLTWQRLGLLLGIGVLVSAGVFVATQWLKNRLPERLAPHFARLFPTLLGTLLGLATLPVCLQVVGVVEVASYEAPYLVGSAFVGFVGGAAAKTSHETVKFLREFIPELIRKKTSA